MSKSKDGKVGQTSIKGRALSLRVQDAALEPVVTAFKQHVENIDFLEIVPHILISYGYEKVAWFNFFWKRAKIDEVKEHRDFDDLWRQTEEKVKEAAEKEEAQKEFRRHLWETAKGHLLELTKDQKVGEALRLIRQMRLLLSWTSFECLASDSSEAAVNVRPLTLGHPAFANLPQDSEDIAGLETKSVSVGLLAKYGFDIRGKLGTLLKPKFDFTGVSGIREAYAAAFGDKLPLDSILGDENLSQLEVVRHAIVHRAGIADELYLKRTHSAIGLGAPIEVDDKTEEALVRASVDAGHSLLEHIDRYLMTNTEQAPLEH